MPEYIKRLIYIVVIFTCAAMPAVFFNLREIAKKNRLKCEEQLQIEAVLKKNDEKQLSLTEKDRDFFKEELERKAEEQKRLELQLANYKKDIASADKRITEADGKVLYTKQRTEEVNSNINELKNRIANIIKDTLKTAEELSLLEKTRDALKRRLLEYVKEKKSESHKPEEASTLEESEIEIPPKTKAVILNQTANTSLKPALIGEVLTVNKEFNFIVVNLGMEDDIKEGAVLDIYHDDKKLGSAEVEKVRETISAAKLMNKEDVSKMKPGDKVFLY